MSGRVRWGFEIFKPGVRGVWSLGLNLDHWDEETYLYINLGRYRLTVGKFWQPIQGGSEA